MEWMEWKGKRVFIRTTHGKVYSGIIKDVDTDSKPLIFISIIDKFNNDVMLSASEIVEIKEESE